MSKTVNNTATTTATKGNTMSNAITTCVEKIEVGTKIVISNVTYTVHFVNTPAYYRSVGNDIKADTMEENDCTADILCHRGNAHRGRVHMLRSFDHGDYGQAVYHVMTIDGTSW